MTDATLQSAFAPAADPSAPSLPPMGQPTRLPRQRVQPIRAVRAFARLVKDKEDTQQVFEIMQAMNGNSTLRGFRKLTSTLEGGRLAYRRLELNTLLNDQAYLAGFAPGTVGAAYREFMREENLSAEGLAEESRKAARRNGTGIDLEHPVAWYGRRIRDTHDIWHVLTGYGRDALGELCLVAFSYAQTRSLGWAVIAVGGSLRALREKGGAGAVRAVREAFRRGKTAGWLPGEDFEVLLQLPLEVARARLRLEAPPAAYLAVPPHRRNGGMGRQV
jgi:ubiquinone biosynthesis protein COQ4